MRSRRALSPLITYFAWSGCRTGGDGCSSARGGGGARRFRCVSGIGTRAGGVDGGQLRLAGETVLPGVPVGADGRWMCLTAGQVDLFVTRRALMLRPRSAQVAANGIRALVRWMWLETLITGPLDHAVGRFAASAATTLPKALTPAEVDRLFAALVGEEAEERSDDRVDATARFTRR